MYTEQNSIVIPASEPGSISGGGEFPVPTMDPGSEAGMTMVLFDPLRNFWRPWQFKPDTSGLDPG
jgi:hypothetical protein